MRFFSVALFVFLAIPMLSIAQDECECAEGRAIIDKMLELNSANRADSISFYLDELNSFTAVSCKHWLGIWQAKAYLKSKDYNKARKELDILDKAVKVKACDKLMVYHNYAFSEYFYRTNQYDSSSVYALKSLELAEKTNDEDAQVKMLNQLALLFNRLNQTEKGMFYRKKGVALARKSNNIKLLAPILTNLAVDHGRLYDHYGDTSHVDSAKIIIAEAIKAARKAGDLSVQLQAYNVYAAINLVNEDYDNVLRYTDSTVSNADPKVHDLHLGSAYYKKSDAYIELNRYKEARAAADSAYKYATNSNSASLTQATLIRVYETSELLGEYKRALEAYKKYTEINDSLRSSENTAIVNELEQKYNKAENEKTISELNQQKQIDSLRIRFLIAGVAISVLVIILVVFFYRQSLLKNKQQMLEAEQRLNRARMDPHFFFNALSSVQTAMLEGKSPQETALYLSRFAKIMRQSLESTYNELIPVEEEVEFLENYINIQKERHPDKFDYGIRVDDSIDPIDVQVPAMIIQPFVENAIEHAFKGIEYKGLIIIEFHKEGDGICIVIEDNGIGTEGRSGEPKKGKHVSRALQIIEDRLFILNTKTKKKASFEVINKQGESGTKVKINLPLL